MNVVVAMITFRRPHLLRRTLASLDNTDLPFTLCLMDNGSQDAETHSIVSGRGGFTSAFPHSVGFAKNMVMTVALARKPDLVLLSDDDYEYRAGWLETLTAFWRGIMGGYQWRAPHHDIIIAGTTIEPVYRWNAVTGSIEGNGVRALVRESVPGGGWSFPARHWPLIAPFPDQTQNEDTALVRLLARRGWRFAALNLAQHIGEGQSIAGTRLPQNAPLVDLAKFGMA